MGCQVRMRVRRALVVAVVTVLTASLAGCGAAVQTGGGPVSIDWYIYAEPSGAFAQAAKECSENTGGRYVINYHKLPTDADGQRQQMVRRLAAHSTSMDILGLDVTWAAEFAEADWILPWKGEYKRRASQGTLEAPLETATWEGQLYAAPYNTNTQLLWYRSDLVDEPPKTWDEMLDMADRLAEEGKPHYVEIQGAQYEGLTVWFNTLVESTGGSILTDDAEDVSLGKPAIEAAKTMARLANSAAADPSLSVQQEDQTRLAMESGAAAFELNYPFVYPSMKANKPQLFKSFEWAPYPRMQPGEPAHVTIGGFDLAVSAYSPHPDLAFEATLCLRNREHQKLAAIVGGLPPTIESLYHDPQFRKEYPFADAILKSLERGSVRPKTPAYQSISIMISHALSPPSEIRPRDVVPSLRQQIQDALESKGLIP